MTIIFLLLSELTQNYYLIQLVKLLFIGNGIKDNGINTLLVQQLEH